MILYTNAFLEDLKETSAKEKRNEKKDKDNKTNSISIVKPRKFDAITKKVLNNLPLTAAKNFAKSKIRELFNKYKPDLEKLKKLWEGEKNWMSYLERCDSPEEIVSFLQKLEQAIIRQSQKSQGEDKKPSTPQKTWILPFIYNNWFNCHD